MNWLKTIVAASSVAIIGSVASASTTNFVENGSFEDIGGAVLNGNGWTIVNGIPGWEGKPNIELQTFDTLGFAANDDDFYAELDTNQDSRIEQEIDLDIGTYLLSFFYSPRVNESPTSTNDLQYLVSAGGELASGTIEGAPNNDYPWRKWTEVQAYFTITGANETINLSFAAEGGSQGADNCGSCGALIDSVSIAAVPLPAGVLLMLSALGAFGFARRRTQA